MNIIQLSKYYPPTYGGIEIVAELLSRALVELGNHVDVISLGTINKKYDGRYGEQVYQNHETIKLSSSPISINYFKSLKKIIEKKKVAAILVHLPNPFAHEIIKYYKQKIKSLNIQIVGVFHSDIINQVILRDTYNFYFKKDIDLYDSFICSSANLKNSSPILSLLDNHKVKIVPFCIDHPYLSIKRNQNFKGKFLAVGRMVPYKGYEFLIEAFNNLPYQLTIVGDGPLNEKLKKMAKPNIKFVGHVTEEEKYKLFCDYDALIVSSINRAEAYGMTIAEAFSVGLPVISSDIDTGVTYLVQDKITGLTFPINNSEIFKNTLKLFSDSENLRLKLSKNCLDFYDRNLTFKKFKDNLSQII